MHLEPVTSVQAVAHGSCGVGWRQCLLLAGTTWYLPPWQHDGSVQCHISNGQLTKTTPIFAPSTTGRHGARHVPYHHLCPRPRVKPGAFRHCTCLSSLRSSIATPLPPQMPPPLLSFARVTGLETTDKGIRWVAGLGEACAGEAAAMASALPARYRRSQSCAQGKWGSFLLRRRSALRMGRRGAAGPRWDSQPPKCCATGGLLRQAAPASRATRLRQPAAPPGRLGRRLSFFRRFRASFGCQGSTCACPARTRSQPG